MGAWTRTHGIVVGGVVLCTLANAFVFGSTAGAQQRDRLQASWSNGHGDCGVGDNGTGFIANFNSDAEVLRDGDKLTITFIGAATGPIFKPVTGQVEGDGAFALKGRDDRTDEDYTFRGRVG